MSFNPAISILIHESPDFFRLQCANIRHYYPNAPIVVHVAAYLWKTRKKKIERICREYDVMINPEHLVTGWSTPSVFTAVHKNMNILSKLSNWTHYIFISSNELFVSGLLESVCSVPETEAGDAIMWDAHCGLIDPIQHNKTGSFMDEPLQEFMRTYNLPLKGGYDFGRVMNRKAFDITLDWMNRFWLGYDCPVNLYSQLEVALPTLLMYLEQEKQIRIIRDKIISEWITRCHPDEEGRILIKHIPRDIHDPLARYIASKTGIHYTTNIFQRWRSAMLKNPTVMKYQNKSRYAHALLLGIKK